LNGEAGRLFAPVTLLGVTFLSSADKLKVLIALLLKYKTTVVLLEHETVAKLLEIPLLALDELWKELVEAEDKHDATRHTSQAHSVSGVNLFT
jgi:hypothetical protein